MRLPGPVYEALPYALICCGIVLGAAAAFSTQEWLQTTLLVAAAIAATVGLMLVLKRRDYRMSRSRVKYDRLQ